MKPKTCLTDGSPVTDDFSEILPNGQQKAYIVLTPEERAKGFVRPVRKSYKHVGIRPRYPIRDLTEEEKQRYAQFKYIAYEEYPKTDFPVTGRYWTQAQLSGGCGTVTTMSPALAETYARDPKFYGATFCCSCQKHFPVAEFIWEDDGTIVGS
jgi:hypothetical protein